MRVALTAALTGLVSIAVAAQQAPRTPWGDPDFQGTYTNIYENGTPLERPDQFAGRKRSVYRNANPGTQITERFTRIAPDKVRWSDHRRSEDVDPPMDLLDAADADESPVPSYECHEGNYRLRNILGAARAEERERGR